MQFSRVLRILRCKMTQHLTSGNLLIRNSAINLAGKVLPIFLAVFFTPWVIGQLGDERYGLFAFCWLVFGYFNLFDFGFGRALTKLLSEHHAKGATSGFAAMVVSVNRFQYGIGIVLGLGLWFGSEYLVRNILDISPHLQQESLMAFKAIAVYLPFLLTFYAFSSVLESKQRFDKITLWQTLFSIAWYALPAIIVLFSTRIDLIISILLVVRLLHWCIIRTLAWRELPADDPRTGSLQLLRNIFSFGGWLAADNMIAPLVTQIDRYIIGAVLGMAALGYYQAPLEMVTKVNIIPMAFAGVLYPALAHAFASDKLRAERIYTGYYNLTQCILFPILLVLAWFGTEILQTWLALSPTMSDVQYNQFIAQGAPVMRIFAIGVFFNGLAALPLSYIQTLGRPDLTTKAHFVQLPVFAAAAYWAILHYGLMGGAFVMSLRMVADHLILNGMVHRFSVHVPFFRTVLFPAALAMCLFLIGVIFPMSVFVKLAAACMAMAAFVIVLWNYSMDDGQRTMVKARLNRTSRMV